ncbi:hypothetical protein SOVF_089420 isoform A [Spinacia oleracea]|uniref:Prolyl endopeptidase n=1 Tax=Spinacia oleracea TaxID=3562 RepID=A0A9R0IJR6_SPIOL|nr:uncharacterized protein LOC110789939 [Spinacia oleracea]KNA16379.1 hypothetical protein SOVF_089420 isoform A [Spinacia oleracea]
MSRFLRKSVFHLQPSKPTCFGPSLRQAHRKAQKQPPKPPPPPTPPKPPKKAEKLTAPHGETWEDQYSWMSKLDDKVAMRHMDVYMEQEEKYTEAVLSETHNLQSKLQSEIASRLPYDLSSPPFRWGPWLYYRRVEEGKQFPVLCRRLASLNEEFISNKSPFSGFDFTSGKRIEQKLIDYNLEAERFGGYAFEELCEVSPDHRYIAYTMYDKDNDFFKLSVRDLITGSLCDKPQADWVSNVAWAKNVQSLFYVVTDHYKRPCKLYCSMLGSNDDDVLLLEEPKENVYVSIRHTKDFHFVTVYIFSTTGSKVFLIDSANPLSGMTLVWDGEPFVHCVVEHHGGYLYLFTDAAREGQPVDSHYLLRSPVDIAPDHRVWETVFVDDPDMVIVDVDFSDTHLVLILREGQTLRLGAVPLPLPNQKEAVRLVEHNPRFLPLPKHICEILPGPNYDFNSSTVRFTVSSPLMPDAVVDYDLLSGKWNIIQQQNLLHERTRILYGKASTSYDDKSPRSIYFDPENDKPTNDENIWNDLSEFYACEQHNVCSHDGVMIPLTVVYAPRNKTGNQNPALLHGHGAYGELLDKRWRSELKSLLDRGWLIAYADVRGGGGRGKKWHRDGRRSMKLNSIQDFLCCGKFMVEENIVHENKLAAWGYSAGGLLVASAINACPELFRAAVLKVPFLDPTTTLMRPILPLTPVDYEEFGYPFDIEDFEAMQKYSPYNNIRNDLVYPSVLITSCFSTRFGVWEAAKWAARVRERTIYDPARPILLNLTTEIVEENRYLKSKELALETAFLLKMMES